RGRGTDEIPSRDFAAFLRGFGAGVRSKVSWGLAAIFAVAAVPQFFLASSVGDALTALRSAGPDGLAAALGEWSVLRLLGIGATAAIGLVLGLLAWRMVAVGIYIYRLGTRFDTRVQVQHPDGAGGLAPLGEVCFLNALILIVPSIFLGIWRTLIAT